MTLTLAPRIATALFGAALLALAGACSDVPSSPSGLPTRPLIPEQPIARVADVPLMDAVLPTPLPGERRLRRKLQGPDGQQLTVESLLGTDGRPRVTLVSRDGIVMFRVENAWRSNGWNDVQQTMYLRTANGGARVLDSRSLSASQMAEAREQLAVQARQLAARTSIGRIRRLEEDPGTCDAAVKAADIAATQYMVAAVGVFASGLSANPLVVLGAYSAFLATYANYESKQADLDKCVAAAGKKPVVDEY